MPDLLLRHVTDETHTHLKEAADEHNMSLSAYASLILNNHFERDEWVHAYSIAIDYIEYVQCSSCGNEFSVTDLRPMDIKFYRLYDQNDRFRTVVCENCLSEI